MEEYEKFVQRRLSELRESVEEEEEHNNPLAASSLIRFYGRAILPPLVGAHFYYSPVNIIMSGFNVGQEDAEEVTHC